MRTVTFAAMALAMAISSTAAAEEAPMAALRSDQTAYLALYKELVETNTTLSVPHQSGFAATTVSLRSVASQSTV